MEVVRFDHVRLFWEASKVFLEKRSVENNLLIGLSDRELASSGSFSELRMFLGKVIACFFMIDKIHFSIAYI